MEYTELIKETDAMIRRIMLHQVVGEWVLMIAVAVLMTILVIMAAENWYDRRRAIQQRRAEMERDQQEWADIRETFGQQGYFRRM
jgi:cell division protein FtsL